MAKAKQLERKILERVREGNYGCNRKLVYEYLTAVSEEALEEKATQEKEEKKVSSI